MGNPFTVRAFLDSMNRILEKEAKEALAQSELRVVAELMPECNRVGQACLWSVHDVEGRTMLWMIPEALAQKCRPGDMATAVGSPVLWPSSKEGKRLEWLHVRELDLASSGVKSRSSRARQLAQEGLLGWRKKKEWPIDAARGSVKVHLVIGEKDGALKGLRHYFEKGRRFNLQVHLANMNQPASVARGIQKASRLGGDFLLLVQQEEDNCLVFDAEVILAALKTNSLYTFLIQPREKIKPFGYWWVEEWSENPYETAQQVITRCWKAWKGPKDKLRLQEALVEQTQKDRTRFVGELSRLRKENQRLEQIAMTADPQRLEELQEQLAQTESRLQQAEERRKVILNQLFGVEQERDELKRKIDLLEAGGLVQETSVDVETEIQKIRREEEFKRALVEEERERLHAENQRLKSRLDETSPMVVEELKEKSEALIQELSRSEERREQLSEVLFLLEHENRELKGRLGFREELDDPGQVGDGSPTPEETILVGKMRLFEEIRDLLVKEEVERLQREVESLEAKLEKAYTEHESLHLELQHLRSRPISGLKDISSVDESRLLGNENGQESLQEGLQKEDNTDSLDILLDKTISFFKHGFRWRKDRDK